MHETKCLRRCLAFRIIRLEFLGVRLEAGSIAFKVYRLGLQIRDDLLRSFREFLCDRHLFVPFWCLANRIVTKGWARVISRPKTGRLLPYVHEVVDHAIEYVRDHVHTNGIENF